MSLQQVERKWSPIEIETLLRCYYSASPMVSESAAQDAAIKSLFGRGLLKHNEMNSTILVASSRGIAFVNLILSLELPISVWVDDHGNILHEQKEL